MRAVLQGESSECGLACLVTILSAHGMHADIADLRRRFPVSLKGARLAQLIRHAEALGLAARPPRLEMDELQDLAVPCILHWDLNHFVVLKRVKGQREALYQLTVELASQQVLAYGEPTPLRAGMTLDAAVVQERRRVIEWVFEPLIGAAQRRA